MLSPRLANPDPHWLDRPSSRTGMGMPPLAFTNEELATLACAMRREASIERRDADAQRDSSLASIATRTAEEYERLAAKIEAMRAKVQFATPPDNVLSLTPTVTHRCDSDGPPVEVAWEAPTCSECGVPQVFG